MGAYLEKPIREKTNETGSKNGISFALSSMQGWRQEQEDAHICQIELNQDKFKNWSLFMVFDGHGGDKVANYVSEHFTDYLLDQDYFKNMNMTEEINQVKLGSAICDAFLDFDEKMEKIWEENQPSMNGGCTAVGILITEEYLIFINLGDSRAFYSGYKNKDDNKLKVLFSTKDHKPGDVEEKKRILNAGGTVEKMLGNGPDRVDGDLAVSRAFGDYTYKDQPLIHRKDRKVSSLPEISFTKRNKEHDSFALIACDGIYDVASNLELTKYLEYRFKNEEKIQSITDELLETCLSAGSKDNMSAILVRFDEARPIKIDYDEIEKVKKIKEDLEEFMWSDLASCHKNFKPETQVYIEKLLKLEKFDQSWIPGAGVHGFCVEIEKIIDEYYELNPVRSKQSTKSIEESCIVEDPPE